MTSKNVHSRGSDTWLTPLWLIKLLGPFDCDPCVCENMPWKTAKIMYTEKDNGLIQKWKGYTWLNPPYSDNAPFIKKMIEHHNGILLMFAKGTGTIACQQAMKSSDLVFFLKKRLQFHYSNGICSNAGWLDNMLLAFGSKAVKQLYKASKEIEGVLMRKY